MHKFFFFFPCGSAAQNPLVSSFLVPWSLPHPPFSYLSRDFCIRRRGTPDLPIRSALHSNLPHSFGGLCVSVGTGSDLTSALTSCERNAYRDFIFTSFPLPIRIIPGYFSSYSPVTGCLPTLPTYLQNGREEDRFGPTEAGRCGCGNRRGGRRAECFWSQARVGAEFQPFESLRNWYNDGKCLGCFGRFDRTLLSPWKTMALC